MAQRLSVLTALVFCAALGVSEVSAAAIVYNFEGPASQGFTSTATGLASPWQLTGVGCAGGSTGCYHSGDPSTVSTSTLLSPVIASGENSPLLSFDNNFNLETSFDGGVVEIAVNGGSFVDVFSGTNAWISAGYNSIISVNFSSPIAGRQAFSGHSLGFLNSSILLNSVSAGDTFQLRWITATDSSVADVGWTVDNITVGTTAVPEPSTMVLFGLGGGLLSFARRRRRS